MLRHCVMFTWKENTDPASIESIRAGLDEVGSLDVVASYHHGPDLGLRDDNFDYVVVGDFATKADYDAYAADPGHQKLIAEWIAPNISARTAVQYEWDEANQAGA